MSFLELEAAMKVPVRRGFTSPVQPSLLRSYRRSGRRRRGLEKGFTLVELLVVIAIIGILVALLLPAVQKSREAARRIHCQNNLKQMGIALHLYHDTYHVFPPSSTSDVETGVWSSHADRHHLHSWASMMLPFIEQGNLHDRVDYSASSLSAANRAIAETRIPCDNQTSSFDRRRLAPIDFLPADRHAN